MPQHKYFSFTSEITSRVHQGVYAESKCQVGSLCYGSTNEYNRTNALLPPLSEVSTGVVSLSGTLMKLSELENLH